MKKQPFQDDLDHYRSLDPAWENDEDLYPNGLDHSDDEDDRHYGNDLDDNDYLFDRDW